MIGKGLRLMRLFNSRKSLINLTVPSFFGMMNVGAAHSLRFVFLRTPSSQSLSTSMRSVCSYALGMGYGRAW